MPPLDVEDASLQLLLAVNDGRAASLREIARLQEAAELRRRERELFAPVLLAAGTAVILAQAILAQVQQLFFHPCLACSVLTCFSVLAAFGI